MRKIVSAVICLLCTMSVLSACGNPNAVSSETVGDSSNKVMAIIGNSQTEDSQSESLIEATDNQNISTKAEQTEPSKQDISKKRNTTTNITKGNASSVSQGPNTNPPKSEPYLVRIECVSESHPITPRLIDGQSFFTVIYGAYRAMQIGDSYTYRVVMSDGGNTGFEIVEPEGGSKLDYVVNGNLITITAKPVNFGGLHTFVDPISVKSIDENGKSTTVSLNKYGRIRLIQCSYDIASNQNDMFEIIKGYGYGRGLGFAFNEEDCAKMVDDDECHIPIRNSETGEWISKVFKVVNKYSKAGYTLWSFGFDIAGDFNCKFGK